MLKTTWLSQFKLNNFLYSSKGLRGKQCISLFILFALFSFNVNANNALPKKQYTIQTLATQLNSPWSMVQLPDGTWLITERDGHVVVIKNNEQSRIKLPLEGLYVAGQGGLLDIVLTPNFAKSKEVFFTYAQGDLDANRLVIAKATFNGTRFTTPTIIYNVATDKDTPQHYSGRALILPDNTLLFSSGDGFDYREQAQVVTSQLGKTLRITANGKTPKNNPFIDHKNSTAHAVYSYGHRNLQGLVYDYDTQQIVSHEHGPAGGDELNYLTAGNNYGWPVITNGDDYSQARISPFRDYPGMQKPSVDWTPSIAPSGMAYYGSKHAAFPSLQKHVLITTLVDKKLYSVNLANGKFTQSHVFPEATGRLRDVFVTSQGNVAILTDGKNAELMLFKAN
ncbi:MULTISPECIES: PQQ-dependent sugar dehydrogenase [unclassified Pseudoalteromonas]|uniref:PQQ-dependent sugar dehydrogenase n=1 Tax=unclassified Pseudoalteromonas TaxID=194690 RepID=UPI001FB3ED2C|nr:MULTISPECIES: PQQ-dependent sugar dehydrogenase [unclassified Pseudoalteromonas]UOB72286.1 PQQ-dependent sugar dehydrogenase [Pseudoalteromonas sp. APM04]